METLSRYLMASVWLLTLIATVLFFMVVITGLGYLMFDLSKSMVVCRDNNMSALLFIVLPTIAYAIGRCTNTKCSFIK